MAKLSDVVFSAENANKTYAFDVAEVIPADRDKIPGVTYDNHTHEVVISVIDNLDGTLTVTTITVGSCSRTRIAPRRPRSQRLTLA